MGTFDIDILLLQPLETLNLPGFLRHLGDAQLIVLDSRSLYREPCLHTRCSTPKSVCWDQPHRDGFEYAAASPNNPAVASLGCESALNRAFGAIQHHPSHLWKPFMKSSTHVSLRSGRIICVPKAASRMGLQSMNPTMGLRVVAKQAVEIQHWTSTPLRLISNIIPYFTTGLLLTTSYGARR